MSEKITCPKCHHAFEPTQVMRARLEEDLRQKLQAEHDAELAKANAGQAALIKANRALQEEARQKELEIERRIGDEASRVREQTEKAIRERLGREQAEALRGMQEELKGAQAKLSEAAKNQADLLRKQRELEERERTLALDIEKKLDAERDAIRVKIEREAEQRVARSVAERVRCKEQELVLTKKQLDESTAERMALLKRAHELEAAQSLAELELQKRVNEETRKLREELGQAAAMQKKLIESEHHQQLEQARKQITELQQKLEQRSQQVQGEAQELVLAEVLGRAFVRDRIEDVAKGVEGADLTQTVRDDAGNEVGSILWESKRTKNWSDAWLAKVRDDQRAAGATHAVIVTTAMPAGMTQFGERSGVWICTPPFATALGQLLRGTVIEIGEACRASEGRAEKMTVLYQYLSGPQFKAHIHSALETFREMQDGLTREQRAMTNWWKTREKQMQRALGSLAALYGDIRGIAGRQVIEAIDSFELPVPAPLPLTTEGSTELVELLYSLVPEDGGVGNGTLLDQFRTAARSQLGVEVDENEYSRCKDALITDGRLERGKGRGGSVRRAAHDEAAEEE